MRSSTADMLQRDVSCLPSDETPCLVQSLTSLQISMQVTGKSINPLPPPPPPPTHGYPNRLEAITSSTSHNPWNLPSPGSTLPRRATGPPSSVSLSLGHSLTAFTLPQRLPFSPATVTPLPSQPHQPPLQPFFRPSSPRSPPASTSPPSPLSPAASPPDLTRHIFADRSDRMTLPQPLARSLGGHHMSTFTSSALAPAGAANLLNSSPALPLTSCLPSSPSGMLTRAGPSFALSSPGLCLGQPLGGAGSGVAGLGSPSLGLGGTSSSPTLGLGMSMGQLIGGTLAPISQFGSPPGAPPTAGTPSASLHMPMPLGVSPGLGQLHTPLTVSVGPGTAATPTGPLFRARALSASAFSPSNAAGLQQAGLPRKRLRVFDADAAVPPLAEADMDDRAARRVRVAVSSSQSSHTHVLGAPFMEPPFRLDSLDPMEAALLPTPPPPPAPRPRQRGLVGDLARQPRISAPVASNASSPLQVLHSSLRSPIGRVLGDALCDSASDSDTEVTFSAMPRGDSLHSLHKPTRAGRRPVPRSQGLMVISDTPLAGALVSTAYSSRKRRPKTIPHTEMVTSERQLQELQLSLGQPKRGPGRPRKVKKQGRGRPPRARPNLTHILDEALQLYEGDGNDSLDEDQGAAALAHWRRGLHGAAAREVDVDAKLTKDADAPSKPLDDDADADNDNDNDEHGS